MSEEVNGNEGSNKRLCTRVVGRRDGLPYGCGEILEHTAFYKRKISAASAKRNPKSSSYTRHCRPCTRKRVQDLKAINIRERINPATSCAFPSPRTCGFPGPPLSPINEETKQPSEKQLLRLRMLCQKVGRERDRSESQRDLSKHPTTVEEAKYRELLQEIEKEEATRKGKEKEKETIDTEILRKNLQGEGHGI